MEEVNTDETIIYLDRSTILTRMVISIILSAAFTYMIIALGHKHSEGYIVTIGFALFAYFLSFKHLYLLIANKPQIIISAIGVKLPPAKLDTWDKIGNIKFEKVQEGRATKIMLFYTVLAIDGSSVRREINIADFDINNKIQLNELLNNYRLQFYVHTKQEIVPLPGIDHLEE